MPLKPGQKAGLSVSPTQQSVVVSRQSCARSNKLLLWASMGNVTSALDALRAELHEVEDQLAGYDALRKRRERLLAAIEATEAIEAMARPVGTPVYSSKEQFGVIVRRVLMDNLPAGQPSTPSEAAIMILKELGRPTHIRD